jgi:hypothetical protein
VGHFRDRCPTLDILETDEIADELRMHFPSLPFPISRDTLLSMLLEASNVISETNGDEGVDEVRTILAREAFIHQTGAR